MCVCCYGLGVFHCSGSDGKLQWTLSISFTPYIIVLNPFFSLLSSPPILTTILSSLICSSVLLIASTHTLFFHTFPPPHCFLFSFISNSSLSLSSLSLPFPFQHSSCKTTSFLTLKIKGYIGSGSPADLWPFLLTLTCACVRLLCEFFFLYVPLCACEHVYLFVCEHACICMYELVSALERGCFLCACVSVFLYVCVRWVCMMEWRGNIGNGEGERVC